MTWRRSSQLSPRVQLICSQNLHTHLCLPVCWRMWYMEEQSDKEIHRMMSGRVPSAGASVLVELVYITLLVRGCVHQPGRSWNPYYWDFMETSSHKHNQLLTPFPAPLPFLEIGLWSWKFQTSNHGLVFLVASPPYWSHSGAHPELPHRTKDASSPLIT